VEHPLYREDGPVVNNCLLALANAVFLRGSFDILLSQIQDSLNLEGETPVFISLRSMVVELYPQALGSLFVT
jgi:hypothetical protein